MTRRAVIICFALLLAVATGCRTHRNLADGDQGGKISNPTVTETEIPRLDTIRNAMYERYCANYSCNVEGMTINGQIRIVHDSCIWISVNKLIEVGRIMITPKRVSGYSKILGKYYDGSYEEVRKRWGIDIDYATIEALIVGNCPPNCKRSKEPERKGDKVTLWYEQKGKSPHKVTLEKEYRSKLLSNTEISTTTPSAVIRCAYPKRENIGGQMLPSAITAKVTFRGSSKQTNLDLSKIAVNKVQNTPFEIPSKLEKL